MGFFSDLKGEMNWQRMQRIGIRQAQNWQESCDMCKHIKRDNESCYVHGVVVNKQHWTCNRFQGS